MRLLQLVTPTSGLLDLHPRITVVRGLSANGRERLLATVSGLPRGVTESAHGLIEAHGVLLDLSDETLRLLDLGAVDAEPVVAPGDLPARPLHPAEEELRAAQMLCEEASATLSAAHDVVAAAQAALQAARERREAIAAQHAAALSGAADREAEADELVWRLEEAVARRSRLEEERSALTVQATLEPPFAGLSSNGWSPPELVPPQDWDDSANPDAGHEVVLEPGVLAGATDASKVEAALERARLGAPWSVDAPDPLAARLADELEEVEAELTTLGSAPAAAPLVDQLHEARAAVVVAREELAAAEDDARVPEADRPGADELEVVHADLLAAMERAERRLGGNRARHRIDDVRAREQELLERLGYSSYSDYLMGFSPHPLDPEKERALIEARQRFDVAAATWRDLHDQAAATIRRADLGERRRDLLQQAEHLLGRPVGSARVVDDLRELRTATPVVDGSVAAAELQRALDDAGLAVEGERLDVEELVLIAEAWLAEVAELAERPLSAVATSAVHALTPPSPSLVPALVASTNGHHSPSDDQRLVELDAELDEAAEAYAAEYAAIEARVRFLEAQDAVTVGADLRDAEAAEAAAADTLASAMVRLREVQERWDAAERAAGRAADAASAAAAERAASHYEGRETTDVEWYLLSRLAALRSVDLVGSLPMVLDGTFEGMDPAEARDILDRLGPMTDIVQVIVLSETPEVIRWAEDAGPERAAVIDLLAS